MNPLKCSLSELRSQQEKLSADLAGLWPAEPKQPLAKQPTVCRNDALEFAHSFLDNAMLDSATEMLKLDLVGAAVFLRVAGDLLAKGPAQREVSFDIESSLEKREFGKLFAFVIARLEELEKTDRKLFWQPISL